MIFFDYYGCLAVPFQKIIGKDIKNTSHINCPHLSFDYSLTPEVFTHMLGIKLFDYEKSIAE
jgi:hypothetical protein